MSKIIESIKKSKGILSKYLPCDKARHGFYTTAIYIGLALLNPTVAIVAVLALALLTEVFDKMGSGNADIWDFVAGVALPCILYGIELLK